MPKGDILCVEANGGIECDVRNLSACPTTDNPYANTYAVNYNKGSISIFGTCGNDDGDSSNAFDYCCNYSDADAISRIDLFGSEYLDEALSFHYSVGAVDVNLSSGNSGPLSAVAHGNQGDDFIYGSKSTNSNYHEKLMGGKGDDRIRGYAGNDILYGGRGDDTLWGGEGNDDLLGQNGNDVLHGDAGNDRLHGSRGSDTLFGNDGKDWLYGGKGATDILSGGDQDDVLCETVRINPGYVCPANHLAGGNGYDVSYFEGQSSATACATPFPTGDFSVELLYNSTAGISPLFYQGFLINNPTVIDNSPVPPECASLFSLGGMN